MATWKFCDGCAKLELKEIDSAGIHWPATALIIPVKEGFLELVRLLVVVGADQGCSSFRRAHNGSDLPRGA